MMAIHGQVSIAMRRAATSLRLLVLIEWWCALGGAEVKAGGKAGNWELLLNSSGVVAMHMALTYRNTVLMFDQTSAGPSQYPLRPSGKRCSGYKYDPSCWAHSVEYDIATNSIRPLVIETDTWCSSGAFLENGTLAQTGGFGNGSRVVRYFNPCSDRRCDWIESQRLLSSARWYSTSQILPEKDRVFIVGGLRAFTYEFHPKSSEKEGAFDLPFLRGTFDIKSDNKWHNLYPFVHLSSDGNLFIFANRDSILLDYRRNQVLKKFPRIPGNGSRSYPSTGSSVMLPLEHEDGFRKVEVMVCGGAAAGADLAVKRGEFPEALSSCGRLVITDENPEWTMEDMPGPRVMNDMLILPTGHILIINGAMHGCAGWQNARRPSYEPYLYKPSNSIGESSRFFALRGTKIARLYHSSTIILPDGRILVAGSNPYRRYTFGVVSHPTELRVQAFTPYYMGKFYDKVRASNLSIDYDQGSDGIRYGEAFAVWFELEKGPVDVVFYAYSPPFATHSFSMNQRMLKLECSIMERNVDGRMHAILKAPPSSAVAPSGYYLLTVVNGEIPSKSEWVRFIQVL